MVMRIPGLMATLHAAFPRLPLHSRVIIEALVLTGE